MLTLKRGKRESPRKCISYIHIRNIEEFMTGSLTKGDMTRGLLSPILYKGSLVAERTVIESMHHQVRIPVNVVQSSLHWHHSRSAFVRDRSVQVSSGVGLVVSFCRWAKGST